MRPGKVERREFQYVRHGTQTLIAHFDVVTGKVGGSVADTRTEADFVAFLEALFASAAPAMRWRVVCDNLDIHMSSGRGEARLGCCAMTTLAPRSFRSAMMALLSKALSAISPPKERPSMSGGSLPYRSDGQAGERSARDCRAHR